MEHIIRERSLPYNLHTLSNEFLIMLLFTYLWEVYLAIVWAGRPNTVMLRLGVLLLNPHSEAGEVRSQLLRGDTREHNPSCRHFFSCNSYLFNTYSWVRPAWAPQTCAWSGEDFNFVGSHAWKAEVPPTSKFQEVWGVHAGLTQLYSGHPLASSSSVDHNL